MGMLSSLVVILLSLIFLKDQCALILYLVFTLVILRGVIVVYVYFSSLSRYITLRFNFSFYYFFLEEDRFNLIFNSYYINNVYLTVFILLVYLLLILFIVVKFLSSSQFSLRSK